MLEAVGEEYWSTTCKPTAEAKSARHCSIQVITIDQSRFERYRRRPEFISDIFSRWHVTDDGHH